MILIPSNVSSNSPIQYYTGVIKRVSPAQTYQLPDRRGTQDYFMIGIKTTEGKRILVMLNPTDMGWTGELHRSKIYYYRPQSHRIIKTTMSNPEKYVGTHVKVRGELHPINISTQKYRISPLYELILYLEENHEDRSTLVSK